jgi:DNA helicase HerA-like ATPase
VMSMQLESVQDTKKAYLQEQCLVLQVVPPRTASSRDMAALETVMQGLALDTRHPVALEIARTESGRQFLVRATSRPALEHLASQIQARYPQASIQPLTEDPLDLRPGETVAAVELRPGAASYLPLRSWRERELPSEGTDPLLGLLAALSHVPANMRIVTQLALLPLPPTWSQADRRRAVEHPLEPERQRQRRSMTTSGSTAPSAGAIIAMGILVALLLLWYRFSRKLPPWLLRAGTLLLHGKNPQLSSFQMTELIASLVGIGILSLLLLLGVSWVLQRVGRTSIYDMRLVAEKTGRSAYRARLRLFVIDSGEEMAQRKVDDAGIFRHFSSFIVHPREITLARLWDAYRHWRQATLHKREQVNTRRELLHRLTAAYRQYHLAAGGYFVPHALSQAKAQRLLVGRTGLTYVFSGWATDLRRSRHLLSVADVAVLWHLPQSGDLAELPLLERGRARTYLAPRELTTGNGWRIGCSSHAGHTLPISLPAEMLRHNLLAVASTGKGKSTLFLHLARAFLADETDESGLFVMEPHRELIETLTGLIPPARQDDVVLLDVADMAYPPGINPLDATLGRNRDKAVDNLITIFERIWSNSWGPRTENVLEFALKTLADANERMVAVDPQHGPDKQYTLLDVVPLLRNISFRHAVMELVTDSALLAWWQQYYEPMDLRFQVEVTSSVLNKLSKFASSRTTRRILGQPRSTINFTEIIRTGKILLVSTASGVVGADVSALVGATLLGLFHVTLAEQAELQREARRHFLVLIDEFQVFQGADFGTMLAELRKYGGSFGLATQSLAYLDRLDHTLRSTVLSNVDHLFAFTMSGEDARLLHELNGIGEDDITNLDDFTCYARLSVGGRRLPVFSLRLDPPTVGDQERAQHIRTRSRQCYARPVDAVDAMIRASFERSAPYRLLTRSNTGSQSATEEDERGRNGTFVQDLTHTPSLVQSTKAGRQKHRGRGGKAASSMQEHALSMPLMYENLGAEDREE